MERWIKQRRKDEKNLIFGCWQTYTWSGDKTSQPKFCAIKSLIGSIELCMGVSVNDIDFPIKACSRLTCTDTQLFMLHTSRQLTLNETAQNQLNPIYYVSIWFRFTIHRRVINLVILYCIVAINWLDCSFTGRIDKMEKQQKKRRKKIKMSRQEVGGGCLRIKPFVRYIVQYMYATFDSIG